jgi:hypothetical protein
VCVVYDKYATRKCVRGGVGGSNEDDDEEVRACCVCVCMDINKARQIRRRNQDKVMI